MSTIALLFVLISITKKKKNDEYLLKVKHLDTMKFE